MNDDKIENPKQLGFATRFFKCENACRAEFSTSNLHGHMICQEQQYVPWMFPIKTDSLHLQSQAAHKQLTNFSNKAKTNV